VRKVTKSNFARWCGVSLQNIQGACKPGKLLSLSLTEDNLIDCTTQDARQYLVEHGVPELPERDDFQQPRLNPKVGKPHGSPIAPNSWDMTRLENLTVKEIVMKFGTVQGFKQWVDALRSISDYQYRDIRIQESRGDLIPRAVVESQVFPLIDVCFQRLVTDMPDTLCKQIIARVEGGGPEVAVDVQKMIHDMASRILLNTKKSLEDLPFLCPQ